jgi:hypothetical protein
LEVAVFGRPVTVGIFLALGLVAAIVGCSNSNNGNPIAPILGGSSPTPAPSHVPTATPTPGPVGTIGSFDACSFFGVGSGTPPPAVAIPGNYTLMISEGEVTGSTYSQDVGEWIAFNVSGTPSPATPTPLPSATPVPSGTPFSYDVFTGTYSIPGYTVTPGPSAEPSATPAVISPTVGCAIFIVSADRSTLGEYDATPAPLPYNSETIGIPNFGNGTDLFNDDGLTSVEIGGGNLTTFNLNNLTAAGGSATYHLDIGVDGSVVYGPQVVYTDSKLRALKARIAQMHSAMFLRGR